MQIKHYNNTVLYNTVLSMFKYCITTVLYMYYLTSRYEWNTDVKRM